MHENLRLWNEHGLTKFSILTNLNHKLVWLMFLQVLCFFHVFIFSYQAICFTKVNQFLWGLTITTSKIILPEEFIFRNPLLWNFLRGLNFVNKPVHFIFPNSTALIIGDTRNTVHSFLFDIIDLSQAFC